MKPAKHDWPQIIREIIQALEDERPRLSGLHTLTKLMHREHVQITRWLNGREPRHYEGEMLLTIHKEIVSREPTTVSSPSFTGKQSVV